MAELISVIVIAGVLAAVAIPRFAGTRIFESRGSFDQAIQTVRFAQKTAIAWRRTIFVCVTANSISTGAAAGCASPLTHPSTGNPWIASVPSGVTLAPTGNFTFDGIGRPSAGTTFTFISTVPGDPARQIVVEAETGYVHP